MIDIPIFLVIYIYVGLIKLLENRAFNAQYNLEKKLREGCAGLDWGDSAKIEEAITVIKDDKDEIEDPQKKIK